MEHSIQLSQREREVADLVLQGKSNKQVAWLLGISVSTVEFHLKNIYTKHQVSSRIELILKLRNTPVRIITEQLGHSIVVKAEESTHNLDTNKQLNRVTFFRKNTPKDGASPIVINRVWPRYVLMATTAVLASGFLWGVVFAVFIGKAVP